MGNYWKALSSYEEKDIEQYEFCGRTEATNRYYSLITGNLISTLYGRTGCGKTSLLQAGIFPLLRKEAYFPVMCRLSIRKSTDSFAEYLISRVEEEISSNGFSLKESTIPVSLENEAEDDYLLWQYFYGHEFRNREGNIVFPIIVLDQFEEILINNRDESISFLRQLNFLIGDDMLLPEDCYANFRVTISMREDFLYLLEDCIDTGKFSLLRENRMRLSPLTFDQAREVISIGKEIFEPDNFDLICSKLIGLAEGKHGHVSTNMLSLICSLIYDIHVAKGGSTYLTVSDIEKFSKEPLKNFYLNCTRQVKVSTRQFIENRMVVHGFRAPITITEFKENVPEDDFKKLTTGRYKILQVITTGDSECVEVIHDTLSRTIHNLSRANKQLNDLKFSLLLLAELALCLTAYAVMFIETISLNREVFPTVLTGLAVFLNYLYSASIYGKKRISKSNYWVLWGINILVISIAYDNFEAGLSILLGLYLFLNPFINLLRYKAIGQKLEFMQSFKHVITCRVFNESPKFHNLAMAATVMTIIATGYVSGFFMASWPLWILLPFCTALCTSIAKTYVIENNQEHYSMKKDWKLILSVTFLMYLFVISQHVTYIQEIATCVEIIFFLLLGLYLVKRQETITKWKALPATAILILCGLFIPTLFFGYFPESLFNGYTRCWHQPEIHGSIRMPLLAVHDDNGDYGLADRHQMIFQTGYVPIDSVSYEQLDNDLWSSLSAQYYDYSLLKDFITDSIIDNGNSNDISLYTKSGTFSWNESYKDRGVSEYLRFRIEQLENAECNKWTEEEYSKIAELTAAYYITKKDSLAKSLTINYFLRRMLQAEMYEKFKAEKFSVSPETCNNLIDLSLKLKDGNTGNYTDKFIKLQKELADKSKSFSKYVNILSTKSGSSCKLSELSSFDTIVLSKLLDNYRTDTVSYEIVREMLSNSEDFINQSRDSICRHFVDNIIACDSYRKKYSDSLNYNINLAWTNIFLGRYDSAEVYARRSIEIAPNEYVTYTNLVSSLYLQKRFDNALEIADKYKKQNISVLNYDTFQILFPLLAERTETSFGEGIVQDLNHFVRNGIVKDTTTEFFRNLKDIFSFEFNLPNGQGHLVYGNGWNLLIGDDPYFVYKENGERLPLIDNFEINMADTIAICKMTNGDGYRFLDLKNMTFIGDTYDFVWHFSEGKAAVKKDGEVSFIDIKGKPVFNKSFHSEKWLENDHYKLSYHNGRTAVMDSANKCLYYIIDDIGMTTSDYKVPYMYIRDTMAIIGQGDRKQWYVSSIDGERFTSGFDEEFTDILDGRAIYNHFDTEEYGCANDVPSFDISGIWVPLNEKSEIDFASSIKFGDKTSDFLWLGKATGKYYLTYIGENLYVNFIDQKKTIQMYKVELDEGNMSLVDNKQNELKFVKLR